MGIGCALEVWETFVAAIGWWRVRRGRRHEENPRSWRVPLAALGLLVVIAGVAGETVFEALVSDADTAIRTHESVMLSDAENRAARAEAGNVKLGIELESAKAGTARAEQQAAEANIAADRERIERLKLEQKIAPRQLDLSQMNALWQTCRNSSPYRRVAVVTYSLDTEAAVLAGQIIRGLHCPRKDFIIDNRVATVMPMGGFLVGVQVTGPDSALVQSIEQDLSPLELVPEGTRQVSSVSVSSGSRSSVAPDATIVIGMKPPR